MNKLSSSGLAEACCVLYEIFHDDYFAPQVKTIEDLRKVLNYCIIQCDQQLPKKERESGKALYKKALVLTYDNTLEELKDFSKQATSKTEYTK